MFWSLLKFIKYFVQIGLLIWTYTRSLVFLVTLEFSNYFVLFYMNMYQVIGVFGHSWSLFNILFKLFFQYEHIPGHQCFWSLMSLANILFHVICVNWLYEPRDFSNVTNTKTIIDPDYYFSSRSFFPITPKHQITRKNVITRKNSKEISWCFNTKVTKITKWPNGIHNFKRNVMILKYQNDQSYQMTQWICFFLEL